MVADVVQRHLEDGLHHGVPGDGKACCICAQQGHGVVATFPVKVVRPDNALRSPVMVEVEALAKPYGLSVNLRTKLLRDPAAHFPPPET